MRLRFPNWVRSCILCQRYLDNECIPASAMWGDKSRLDLVVLQLVYKKSLSEVFKRVGKDFGEVEEGREAHEILERERGVLRSLVDLAKRLEDAPAQWIPFTSRACSRYFGQRCYPDVVYLRIQKAAPIPKLEVVIVEDKRSFRPTYMMQLYAMGVIFTDFNVMVQMAPVKEGRFDLERRFMRDGVFLYPYLKRALGLSDMTVEVYLSLNIYEDPKSPKDAPGAKMLFAQDFKVVPEFGGQYMGLRRKRRRVIKAIDNRRPYVVPIYQTHFTTRPRLKSGVVKKLDEKYTLYLPRN